LISWKAADQRGNGKFFLSIRNEVKRLDFVNTNAICFWVILAAASLSMNPLVHSQDRIGLLIYTDPPITSLSVAEPINVIALRRKNIAYSDVVLTNGQTREIQNGGILAYFDLPPRNPDADSFAKIGVMEQQAKAIIGKYPGIKASVELVTIKWRAAQLEVANRAALRARSAVPTKAPFVIAVGPSTYSGVSLEAVEGGVAKIYHSDGLADIPLVALTPAQIAQLNSTSTSVRIDPDWPEKLKLAEREKAKRIEEAAKKAVELATMKREALISKARQMEEAARYEEALTGYQEAGSDQDVKRVASSMAANFEKRKDYDSAAQFFELAGLFAEAGRIRNTYSVADSVPTRMSSEELFKRCAPATVSILTKNRRSMGVGSGFFVRSGGYILTNNHVVENATSITVVVDKESFEGTVVAHSEMPDLALLKIALPDHAVLAFADSEKVKPGAQAFAIGTPKGLPKSITGGMISATDRKKFGNNVFQMSVLINHGNSGGPVLNEGGKVIGIATFGEGTAAVVDGLALGSDIQGINYAIKGNEAKALLNKIPR